MHRIAIVDDDNRIAIKIGSSGIMVGEKCRKAA